MTVIVKSLAIPTSITDGIGARRRRYDCFSKSSFREGNWRSDSFRLRDPVLIVDIETSKSKGLCNEQE